MTEPVAREGAVEDVKGALGAFARDLRSFQDRVETRLKTQEDRMALIDRKAAKRPALAVEAEARAPQSKAVSAYLRNGDEAGLRALELDRKGLSAAAGAEGGFLVDRRSSAEIAQVLRGAGCLRQVAKVVQIEGGVYEALIDRAEFESAWVAETAPRAETAATRLERVTIPLHELSAMPKVTQRLLEDSAFDIEAWLSDAIADKFARAETAAFVSGDGLDKPKGFLTHPAVPVEAWSWGSLGYVATGVSGGFPTQDPSDALVDVVYSLGVRYRANAAFVMNSATAGLVRKMRDADGRFLWTEGLASREPARVLGYPVVVVEEMPNAGENATPIAFGDFGAGYTIAERPELKILRDPYSAKPHVQFYATARIGGDVTDFAAIRLLKLSTS